MTTLAHLSNFNSHIREHNEVHIWKELLLVLKQSAMLNSYCGLKGKSNVESAEGFSLPVCAALQTKGPVGLSF